MNNGSKWKSGILNFNWYKGDEAFSESAKTIGKCFGGINWKQGMNRLRRHFAEPKCLRFLKSKC